MKLHPTVLLVVGPFSSVDISIDSTHGRPDPFLLGQLIPLFPERLALLSGFMNGHLIYLSQTKLNAQYCKRFVAIETSVLYLETSLLPWRFVGGLCLETVHV